MVVASALRVRFRSQQYCDGASLGSMPPEVLSHTLRSCLHGRTRHRRVRRGSLVIGHVAVGVGRSGRSFRSCRVRRPVEGRCGPFWEILSRGLISGRGRGGLASDGNVDRRRWDSRTCTRFRAGSQGHRSVGGLRSAHGAGAPVRQHRTYAEEKNARNDQLQPAIHRTFPRVGLKKK
jgi:hypothetical protein